MSSASLDVSESGSQPRLIRLLDKIATSVELRPWVAIVLISLLYLACSLLVSATKLLWLDELFTYHTSRLATASDVIRFVASGLVDAHPPTSTLLERWSIGLLGDNFVGLRAPYIMGYLLFCLCLYGFVRSRAGALWGLAAMTFPLVCPALYYATEARPYALLLGCSGMAALSWQQAGEPRKRRAAIAVLWLSLALSTTLHYYAVFLAIPFVVAEISRWRQFRRADWTVVWAILTAPLTIVFFIPAIRRTRMIYAAHFWGVAQWSSFKSVYVFLLSELYRPIAIASVVCLVIALRDRNFTSRAAAEPVSAPPSDIRLAGMLALLPIVVLPASFLIGGFSERYVLPALTGISLYLVLLAWRACGGHRIMALAIVVVFLGWFVLHTGATVTHDMSENGGYPFRSPQPYGTRRWLPLIEASTLPVVISPGAVFLQFQHYAPVDLQWRVYYLANQQYATLLDKTDTTDVLLVNLAKAAPGIYVPPYDEFVSRTKKFLLVADVSGQAWILHKLKIDGAHLELLMRHRRELLFEVTMP